MILDGFCHGWKVDALRRQAGDRFMIALYTAIADLSPDTPAYTPIGEVPASGTYQAGGQALVGYTVASRDGVAYAYWTHDPLWSGATISAAGALIYNASRQDLAVGVLDFGRLVSSTNAPFLVAFPPPSPTTALLQVR